jgi:hypothetical protein
MNMLATADPEDHTPTAATFLFRIMKMPVTIYQLTV